jgi:hypothetical protein
MNEITLQLCSLIINDHNKSNLLKTWDDALWLYPWIEGIEGSQHCVWLTIIPMKERSWYYKNLIGMDGLKFL